MVSPHKTILPVCSLS